MPKELIISCDAESTEKYIEVELTDAELAERHITDAAAYAEMRAARKQRAIDTLKKLAACSEVAEAVLEVLGLNDD